MGTTTTTTTTTTSLMIIISLEICLFILTDLCAQTALFVPEENAESTRIPVKPARQTHSHRSRKVRGRFSAFHVHRVSLLWPEPPAASQRRSLRALQRRCRRRRKRKTKTTIAPFH